MEFFIQEIEKQRESGNGKRIIIYVIKGSINLNFIQKMIEQRELFVQNGIMEIDMKESLKIMNQMELENINGRREIFIQESGKMEYEKEQGFMSLMIKMFIMEIGKMIR